MFQTIDTAEPNFPVNLFTAEEDTAEIDNSNCLAINCCDYAHYNESIHPIGQTDVDE